MHMLSCFDVNGTAAASNSRCMDRPIAIGGFSGIASSLALSLLRSIVQDQHTVIEVPTAPTIGLPAFECPQISFEDIPLWTFAAGVAVGLLAGPTLDLLWLVRQRWRRFIWRVSVQEQHGSGKLFKIIA